MSYVSDIGLVNDPSHIARMLENSSKEFTKLEVNISYESMPKVRCYDEVLKNINQAPRYNEKIQNANLHLMTEEEKTLCMAIFSNMDVKSKYNSEKFGNYENARKNLLECATVVALNKKVQKCKTNESNEHSQESSMLNKCFEIVKFVLKAIFSPFSSSTEKVKNESVMFTDQIAINRYQTAMIDFKQQIGLINTFAEKTKNKIEILKLEADTTLSKHENDCKVKKAEINTIKKIEKTDSLVRGLFSKLDFEEMPTQKLLNESMYMGRDDHSEFVVIQVIEKENSANNDLFHTFDNVVIRRPYSKDHVAMDDRLAVEIGKCRDLGEDLTTNISLNIIEHGEIQLDEECDSSAISSVKKIHSMMKAFNFNQINMLLQDGENDHYQLLGNAPFKLDSGN